MILFWTLNYFFLSVEFPKRITPYKRIEKYLLYVTILIAKDAELSLGIT
jgi:hypothetical protein